MHACVYVTEHVKKDWFRWREKIIFLKLEISMVVACSKKGKNISVFNFI